ncbi:hypothetical protein NECAME_11190, partial [Necator americanus]
MSISQQSRLAHCSLDAYSGATSADHDENNSDSEPHRRQRCRVPRPARHAPPPPWPRPSAAVARTAAGRGSFPPTGHMPLSRTVMHKLQFARGIGQREMLRANTLPSITRAKSCCDVRDKLACSVLPKHKWKF